MKTQPTKNIKITGIVEGVSQIVGGALVKIDGFYTLATGAMGAYCLLNRLTGKLVTATYNRIQTQDGLRLSMTGIDIGGTK